MADVNIDISANSTDFTQAVSQINASVARMQSSVQNSVAGMNGAFSGLTGSIAVFSTAINQTLSAVRKLTAGLSEAWQSATQFQSASVRLAPLVGGLTNARELCEALRESAINGTASFEELTSVATRLSSVFSDTKQIEAWTKRFHDLSAGTGADMNRIVSQFTRAMASGNFSSTFLDQLSMRGVNIYAEIAEQTGMAENELRKLAQTGQLSFSQVESALISLTSGTGVFANASQRMSQTAGGSWNTLTAQITATLAKFAEPIADAITPFIQQLTRSFASLAETADEFGRSVASVISFIGSNTATATTALGALLGAFLQISGITPRITASFSAMVVSIRTQSATLGGTWRATMLSMRTVATTAFTAIRVAGVACLTAIKSAIVSTGIGVAIIAIGEAIAFAYGKFTEWREETNALEKSTRSFAQTLKTLDEASANSGNSSQQAELVARIQSEMQSITAELQVQDDENGKIANQLRDHLAILQQRLAVEETSLKTMREQEAISAQEARNANAKAKYEADRAKDLEAQKPLQEQINNLKEKQGKTLAESEEFYAIQRQIDALQKRLDVEKQITAEREKQADQAWQENRNRQSQEAEWQRLANESPDQARVAQRSWEDIATSSRQNGDTALARTATENAELIARMIEKADANRAKEASDQQRAILDAERSDLSTQQSAVSEAMRNATSTVSSSQASVGGGVSMGIGQDIATSLQRQQVSLQQRMADLLEQISENTQSQTLTSVVG